MNIQLSHGLIATVYLSLCLITGTVQAGSIYKWVDKDGGVHYGQLPEGENATQLSRDHPPEMAQEMAPDESAVQPNNAATPPAGSTKAQMDALRQQNEAAREEVERQNAAIVKRNEEVSKNNCKLAQQRLASIQSGGKMYSTTASGEREYWDEARRESELQTAQDAISQWCKE